MICRINGQDGGGLINRKLGTNVRTYWRMSPRRQGMLYSDRELNCCAVFARLQMPYYCTRKKDIEILNRKVVAGFLNRTTDSSPFPYEPKRRTLTIKCQVMWSLMTHDQAANSPPHQKCLPTYLQPIGRRPQCHQTRTDRHPAKPLN